MTTAEFRDAPGVSKQPNPTELSMSCDPQARVIVLEREVEGMDFARRCVSHVRDDACGSCPEDRVLR